MSAGNNPFEELERLFQRMSRQYGDPSRMLGSGEAFGGSSTGDMDVDLVEYDDEFVATVDLPGFEREDVDVQVTDQLLQIDAEHAESTDEEADRYIRRERIHRSMQRSVQLPEEVDTDGVSARMNNGVLTVTLPKVDAEDTRRIEIE